MSMVSFFLCLLLFSFLLLIFAELGVWLFGKPAKASSGRAAPQNVEDVLTFIESEPVQVLQVPVGTNLWQAAYAGDIVAKRQLAEMLRIELPELEKILTKHKG